MSQYIGVGRLGLSQDATYTGTAGTTATPFSTGTYKVRVAVTSDCRIRIGKTPVAVITDTLMPAGTVEYFTAYPGESVSAIQVTAAGSINVTEIS